MSEDLVFLSAAELALRIRQRIVSPVEVVDAFLARIDQRNTDINAYVTLLHDEARQRAREAEQAVMAGAELGVLHGVPIAVKDLFDFKAGVPNTMGSVVFKDFVPDETATYIERMEQAGAIVLGKTNTPEFGHKGITDNLLFGPTRNPFNLTKNAGGSSGGSAAAVADGLAAMAQGSDGGGSIRIPASFSGVYGIKPSYGRVASADAPDAFISHTPFSGAGPLTRTVEDAALMLTTIVGPHPRDPLSMPHEPLDYLGATRRSIRGLKIAYSPRLDVFPVDERVSRVIADAVKAFETAGATVEEVELGLQHSQQEMSALWVRQAGVLYAEVFATFKSMGIDMLGEHRDTVTPELIQMVEAVQDLNVVSYKLDSILRTTVFNTFQNMFERYDILVTPTLAVPPFDNASDGNTIGPTEINGEQVDPLIGWCLTYPFNFTGHPAASVPAGMTDDGLPIGMQIVGRRFADDVVLAASAAFERVRPWQQTYPPRP
jgi:amidase/aspartyl-tRNA(Asn)/glutamyl-tRNA(Gln) amidotransferase subunit A